MQTGKVPTKVNQISATSAGRCESLTPQFFHTQLAHTCGRMWCTLCNRCNLGRNVTSPQSKIPNTGRRITQLTFGTNSCWRLQNVFSGRYRRLRCGLTMVYQLMTNPNRTFYHILKPVKANFREAIDLWCSHNTVDWNVDGTLQPLSARALQLPPKACSQCFRPSLFKYCLDENLEHLHYGI